MMPEYYQAQLEYGPKFAEMQYQQFGQYAPLYTAKAKEIQEEAYPETAALQESLAAQAATGMEEGVPDWMREEYLSGIRAQLGPQAASRMGGDVVSRGLMAQKQSLQDYYRNLGLSITGRLPLQQTMTPGYTAAPISMPGAESIMGYGAGTYGAYTSAAANTAIANAQNQMQAQVANLQYGGSPWGQMLGGVTGGLAGSFTGGAGTTLGNQFGSWLGGKF